MLKQFLTMFQSLCCCWIKKKSLKKKFVKTRAFIVYIYPKAFQIGKKTFVKIFETLFFNLSQIKNVFLSCDTRFSFSNDLSYFNLSFGIGKKGFSRLFFLVLEKVKSNFKEILFIQKRWKNFLFLFNLPVFLTDFCSFS